MALPFDLTPERVREACRWGFWRRVSARRAAASGDLQAAVLLVAHATAKELARQLRMGMSEAAEGVVAMSMSTLKRGREVKWEIRN